MSSTPPPLNRSDINALRRRPPGDRVLVYLDHSTLSELAREERTDFVELRRLLERAIESGRLICPYSPEHRDEAALAPADFYDAIEKVGDVLAMGIEFLARERIEWQELYAAARAFLGQEPRPLWKKAFRADPHTPREKLFFEFMGAMIRVTARFAVDDAQRAEVLHEKAKEDPMAEAYTELRGALRMDTGTTYAVDDVLARMPAIDIERVQHRWQGQGGRADNGDPLLRIPPAVYVAGLLCVPARAGRKVACPFHHDERPSLHVYPTAARGWSCFSCGRGGSIYDMGAAVWGLGTRGRDFVELRRRLMEHFSAELTRPTRGLER